MGLGRSRDRNRFRELSVRLDGVLDGLAGEPSARVRPDDQVPYEHGYRRGVDLRHNLRLALQVDAPDADGAAERVLDYLARLDYAAETVVEASEGAEVVDPQVSARIAKLGVARILPPDLRMTVNRRREAIEDEQPVFPPQTTTAGGEETDGDSAAGT